MRPDVRHVPIDEARKKLGAYADALALDQIVRSPRARALGWAPTLHSVAGNVPRLLEEWRRARSRVAQSSPLGCYHRIDASAAERQRRVMLRRRPARVAGGRLRADGVEAQVEREREALLREPARAAAVVEHADFLRVRVVR